MARNSPPDDRIAFTLRIPPDLHADLLHYAVDGSLNAEILRRLRASIQMDMVDAMPRRQPNNLLRVELDANGRSITWQELNEKVAAIIDVIGAVSALNIEVITPGVVAERDRRREETFADIDAFVERRRADAALGREALERVEQRIKKEAPADMSLNAYMDRVDRGEDPEAAWEDELRKYVAERGPTKPKASASEMARKRK